MFPITKSLKETGYDIYILAPNTGKGQKIISKGFHYIELPLDRKGANPYKEIRSLLCIYNTFKKIKPDIVHNITIKPIVYGSFVANWFKIPVLNTICGLGYSFIDDNKNFGKIAYKAYKKALSYNKAYHFFENKDDCSFFIQKGILSKTSNLQVVNGVGVDLKRYSPCEKNKLNNRVVITMASRMIWEKGVKEFVDVAKLLYKDFGGKVEFRIYGKIDDGNPGRIPKSYLKSIEISDYLKWFGFESNMPSVFQNSDIIVLPSFYREGCPMVLMEACAMGLPILTTDSVGCRECVDEGINGFKVPVKSVNELAKAIEKLVLDKELRKKMGKESRKKAERDFDQKDIINQYLKVYNRMLS